MITARAAATFEPVGRSVATARAFVRDTLGLSDSALSKQFATLETAGYIGIERPLADRRRRVHVRLTDTGRRAFEGHVAALRQIVASVDR